MRTARQILADAHAIAVVGASRDPQKPAHWVPKMLQEQGWHIIPVNPHAQRLFGEHVYARLADVPGHVDVVEVFRPAHEAVEIVREAAAVGAGAVWLQRGIENPQARQLAYELGLDYVEDTCVGVERTLSQMVHGGYTPRCTVYHSIVPEAERPAALVAQRSNIAPDRRDSAASRLSVANPARVRTAAPRSANRADAAADGRQAGRRRLAASNH